MLEIGCSNFTVEQLQQAEDAAAEGGTPRFVSVQNKYSILHREPEHGVLAECSRQGIAFLPYSPVANGLLTGKFRAGQDVPEGTRIGNMAADQRARELSEERMASVEELVSIAEADGRTILDLAFAWLLSHRQVASVIAGATRPEQVRANAATATYHPAAEVLQHVNAVAPL